MNTIVYAIPILGLLGLCFTLIKSRWILRQSPGSEAMQRLSRFISQGALAFLKAQWRVLSYFVILAALLLAYLGYSTPGSHILIAVAFIIGAVFSAFAGWIGMHIATRANTRTTEAATKSLKKAFFIAFQGGAVMGLGVGGLAILGLGSLFILFYQLFVPQGAALTGEEMRQTIEVLTGFSLGAESIALFARVGGGIYTKAADVGADLVGKLEAEIPEDDVRNPATIADNVGDNVGDVAGMGADLFGSYVATILASMVLGQEIDASHDGWGGISPTILPLMLGGIGLGFSILCTYFVPLRKERIQQALNISNGLAMLLTAICAFFLTQALLPKDMELRGVHFQAEHVFYCIVLGLGVGAIISLITEYYTSTGRPPVHTIVRRSLTGHATNIIAGLSLGMASTFVPVLVLSGGMYGAYLLAGLYGVGMAAAGMMATTAMQLAVDAFGPIADNAGGIAEMARLPEKVRERTDVLDAVGNTTAATGKGFAIASAALTSLALFAAFVGVAGIDRIDIYKAEVLAGLFIGATIPFVFSSLAISAVGRAAMFMVEEVRRQFREIKGIMEQKAAPEYEKCIAISTQASLREMLLPGLLALGMPLLIGLTMGAEVLGGFLAGITVSGVLLGIFQNNAGGAWDNAKKSFEKSVTIGSETYKKGSEPHKASITGDTVGDPFKDTSGPSMNILIKLTSIVALVLAPSLSKDSSQPHTHKPTSSFQQQHSQTISQEPYGEWVENTYEPPKKSPRRKSLAEKDAF